MPVCKTCGILHQKKRLDHPRLYSQYCSTKCSLARLKKAIVQNEPKKRPIKRIKAATISEIDKSMTLGDFMKIWLEVYGVKLTCKRLRSAMRKKRKVK